MRDFLSFLMAVAISILLSAITPTMMWGQAQSDYNEAWNKPTISHFTSHYRYQYFADAWPYDRNPVVDISSLPPIPGLKYRSCYYICPNDTCFANRAVFALRCPDVPLLRKWVSSRAEWFAKWCESDDFYEESTVQGRAFTSNGGLLNFYISKIDSSFRNRECERTEPDANRQFALLITDCWRVGTKYTTFYEASWYDNISAGNTVRESYYSVNNKTGKAATIAELVKQEKMSALAEIMVEYLRDSHGHLWKDDEVHHEKDPSSILRAIDGCALIREGLILYFHPYTIASGVEGQITAIIPYKKLLGFLK